MQTIDLCKTLSLPKRLRRNRRSEAIRALVQETRICREDLVAPLFLIEGENQKRPIHSLPGHARLSLDLLLEQAARLHEQGIQAVALFPVIVKEQKSLFAEEAWNPNGLLPQAIRTLKEHLPSLCVISDVALDPYTVHGHDGIANEQGEILNDATVECLCNMALAQAAAGVDYVAPSDMMDGRVKAIREALDSAGFSHTGILSYSIKYASCLYGPYRDALQSHVAFGDKKSYQLDPANARESLLEALLDENEGADILMVKPATLYLDIIAKLREQTNMPIAAYHVSGEYAMAMAAEEKGWLKADQVLYESLLAIKRAGADLIFTYAVQKILHLL